MNPRASSGAADSARRRAPAPEAPGDDWRWQLRHAVRSVDALADHLELSPDELTGARAAERVGLPLAITPYYLSLCDRHDPRCPIRRQVVPRGQELAAGPGDWIDPLGEQAHEVAPGLIRRYPDRALLLLTDRCAVYCRFCTRSRWVGRGGPRRPWPGVGPAVRYLRDHPEVCEVILSGGDPFVMSTERLVRVVRQLREVASIGVIRLATRVPAVLPQRVTDELLTALSSFHPLWVMSHFNHPLELAPAARRACRRLVDAGFPVMNQTVLLRHVNDDPDTLAELFRGLVCERVRPYYLLQADPVRGTGHLRTPLAAGVEIMKALQGGLSGIALPKLIVDTPGGHGKVPLVPDYVASSRPGVTRLRSPWGVEVDYVDPS